jgi:hypothetical protein
MPLDGSNILDLIRILGADVHLVRESAGCAERDSGWRRRGCPAVDLGSDGVLIGIAQAQTLFGLDRGLEPRTGLVAPGDQGFPGDHFAPKVHLHHG